MESRRAARALVVALIGALALVSGCADEEVVEACGAAAECGADQTACITDRQGHLGEIGGRCGDARDEAIAVYVCQGTLACDERDAATYEQLCAAELTAYRDVLAGGAEGACTEAPDPIAP